MSPRLRAGVVLYEGTDGSWRCYETGDRFSRVHADADHLRLLQDVLHGGMTLERAAAATDDPDALYALLAAFEQQGLLAEATSTSTASASASAPQAPSPADVTSGGPDAAPRHPCARARVHVEGDTPIADAVAGQLAGHVATVTRGPVGDDVGADPLDGIDFLISCTGWLTDERWRRLDERCQRAGIGWHMCHAEGALVVLGPCALPGGGPRYADTRARRLAAAPFPDELLAHWRALETGMPLPEVPWPPLGTVLVAAGMLIADACAAVSGQPLPGAGVQTVVDGRTGAVSRHAVRTLPDLQATTS